MTEQQRNDELEENIRNVGAFTLIEIMLAIMIFSLVLAAIYSTWMLILRSTKVGQEAAAQVQRQRIAMRTIEDSLTCIQSFQASMQYYIFIVQNGDPPELSFVARLPDDFPRNGRFGDFNLRRLTFTVEPDADEASENDLVLRQNPILMDMDQDEQNLPLVLARNVKSFTVECWDTNALDWRTNGTTPIPFRRWCASRSRSAATIMIPAAARRNWTSRASSRFLLHGAVRFANRSAGQRWRTRR